MLLKYVWNIFMLFALLVLVLLTTATTYAAPNITHVEDRDPFMDLGYWSSYEHAQANGGALRDNYAPGTMARFKFKGTSITWVTRKGDYAGKAKVLIDGVNKGTFDLYTPNEQFNAQYTFSGLTNTKHTLVIKVLGKKNPAASYELVGVDAFIVGGVTTQEDSPRIQYDSWQGKSNSKASGGTFRIMTQGRQTYLFVLLSMHQASPGLRRWDRPMARQG